jgi:5-methylcytosine-specific restriction endonuclease McrA
MRFTKKDKRAIAEYQGQVREYEDDWSNTGEVVYVCRRCRGEFTRLDDLEVDHIKPRSKGGTDRPSNLQLLCPICNKRKSSRLRGKTTTAKRKPSTVKKKASTVRRKTKTVKRKTSTTKGKQRTTRTKSRRTRKKSSTAKRTRR